MKKKTRILLLGASVGKEWELPELSARMHDDEHVYESVAVYQYDKTEALDEILMRPKRKFRLTKTYLKGFFAPSPQLPDMIIIKECAAYFPGDMEFYKGLIQKWVKTIRDRKIEVMLATAVPVTSTRAGKQPGKIEAIRVFNDFIREYARKENIRLLDLETALRTDTDKRFLKDEFTSGDGLHLNRKAYDLLDHLMQDTCRLDQPGYVRAQGKGGL